MTILDRLTLHGKVALVTGGGTGLGQAMALSMADAGADIAVSGRRREPLEETVRLVETKGRRAMLVQADVTDRAQVARMVDDTVAQLGAIDVMVNNAGGGGAGRGKEFVEYTEEDWHEGLNGNLTQVFFCLQAIVPHFLERGGGRVINVASPSGMRGRRGDFMYGVAKAGVVQLTRAFAMTYARDGIRCTGIAPGAFPHYINPDIPNTRGEAQAIGRSGTTYEIGPLAVFLASEAADYLSGATLLIDGGSTSAGVLPAGVIPLAEG
jgi:NAD(P)-dependent dehydrogenase (short-subunit alcohol dehydrogenase family)